jgi:hemerythrin-like metal-binding protein
MTTRLIEWRDDFSVGLPEVDHEHRELIAMINALQLEAASGAGIASVMAALGEIHARISAHFALEEKCMTSLGYEGYPEHKADHERLLDDIRDIMDDVSTTGRFDPAVLGARLSAWFVGHFSTLDARFHRRPGARD